MLKVTDLSVNYGGIAAVKGLSLEVSPGEIVALVGANGAGKSSTLAAIGGVVTPSSGSVEWEGQPIQGRPPEWIARNGIAIVPEGRDIFATLTVRENLLVGATARKDRSTAAAATERVFERFPVLKRYAKSPAGKLSGGEQQQLAIARALLSEPRILLLDEPSLGLAPKMVDLVFEVVRELRQEGVGVLRVERNALRAVATADRAYVLRRGELVHSGSHDELMAEGRLNDLYLS